MHIMLQYFFQNCLAYRLKCYLTYNGFTGVPLYFVKHHRLGKETNVHENKLGATTCHPTNCDDIMVLSHK